jgi:hypothetical protein
VLEAARGAGAAHFVLLSAICVQKPLLEFQHAKLKLEGALQAAGDISYSIVRPTAFFKSLAGQARRQQSAFVPSRDVSRCVNDCECAVERWNNSCRILPVHAPACLFRPRCALLPCMQGAGQASSSLMPEAWRKGGRLLSECGCGNRRLWVHACR